MIILFLVVRTGSKDVTFTVIESPQSRPKIMMVISRIRQQYPRSREITPAQSSSTNGLSPIEISFDQLMKGDRTSASVISPIEISFAQSMKEDRTSANVVSSFAQSMEGSTPVPVECSSTPLPVEFRFSLVVPFLLFAGPLMSLN